MNAFFDCLFFFISIRCRVLAMANTGQSALKKKAKKFLASVGVSSANAKRRQSFSNE